MGRYQQSTKVRISNCTLLLLVMAFFVPLVACKEEKAVPLNIFNPQKVQFVIGNESTDTLRNDSYRNIYWFYVDYRNNVYVGDSSYSRIDKYNSNGKFEVSFGGPGQGPGEISGNLPYFCADSNGYLLTSLKGTINVYDNLGKYIEAIKYPDDIKDLYCSMIRADHNDDIVIVLRSVENEYRFVKFSRKDRSFKQFHTDSKRKGLYHSFFRFLPGYDFDNSNNIYVLDSVEYRIYIYDPTGKPIRTIDRPSSKEKLSKTDLRYTFGNHVIGTLDPSLLTKLSGATQYLPAICGINIDNNLIFVWRTRRDAEAKNLIDVFNSEFVKVGSSSFYNLSQINVVTMKNGDVYYLNIGDEDMTFKRELGRLSMFNVPYKVFCCKYDL